MQLSTLSFNIGDKDMFEEGNTCLFISPMIRGQSIMKFFWKFILGLTQRYLNMVNWEETSSHCYAEGACDLTIICCTRNWYSWHTFFFQVTFTDKNLWERCLVYIDHYCRWDFMSFDGIIDTIVNCQILGLKQWLA